MKLAECGPEDLDRRSSDGQPAVSVVVPVFNEAENLRPLWQAVQTAMTEARVGEYECIFVNDGSEDGSLGRVCELAAEDTKIKVLDLSRNFGKEVALTAGLDAAVGQAVIFLDADLQHPPSLIPKMVDAWRGGAEVVVTVRRSQGKESFGRKLGSLAFHWIMKTFTDVNHLSRTTDFRLLDGKVARALREVNERERLFRGLIDWLGFRREILEFDAAPRPDGQQAKFNFFSLCRLAVSSFVSHSLVPLVVLGIVGVVITGSAGLLLGWMLVAETLVDKRFYYTPLAQVVVANTLLIGLVISALGVMSLYLAKIYQEVIQRPLYAVRQRWNFDSRPGPPG